MSEKKRTPEEVVREYARAWNAGYEEHEKSLEELYTHNHISHTDTRDMLMGEMTGELRPFFEAFPDMNLHVEEVVIEGNKIAVRYTWTGTMTGSMMGIPPTGKSATMTILEVDTCRDGRFHESWSRTDALHQMEQMGLIGDSGKKFWY